MKFIDASDRSVEETLSQVSKQTGQAQRGRWITCHVEQFTVWTGEDETLPYFKEDGGRRTVQRIYDHLRSCGCRSMHLQSSDTETDVWTIWVRPKDFRTASKIAASNV